MPELVSVLTPCYNGEAFIGRFLDSMLAQTWRPLQVVVVDDGSADATASIVQGYQKHFEKEGCELTLLRQANAGQAAALNAALQVFTGEYVCWPDSDDVSLPTSIERRVRFLQAHPECGFVRTDGHICREGALDRPLGRISEGRRSRFHRRIFDDLIHRRTFVFNHCYLARADALRQAIPGLRIFESRSGQNWQMLLPLAWHFACGFIDEPLCIYVRRDDSHSRAAFTLQRSLERDAGLYDILRRTMEPLGCWERYEPYVERSFARRALAIALRYDDGELLRRSWRRYRRAGGRHPLALALYLLGSTAAGRALLLRARGLRRNRL